MKVKPLQNPTSARPSRISLWVSLLTFLGLLGLLPGIAHALPQYYSIVKTTYAVKAGGAIDSKSCGVCHVDPAGGGAVNPYGKDVKTFLKAAATKTLTSELLHSIDAKDSDGDGFANIDEFKADTLPGDATSHLNKAPALQIKPVKAEGEISPFDIKTAVLARNAQHPVIVHFPIALFLISLLFDVLGAWKKNSALRTTATYNLIVAAFGGLFAVISGLIAWQWQFGGAELKGNLQLHLILGIVTTGLLFLLWGIRTRLTKNPAVPLSRIYFVLSLIALVLISLTGHIGGILSGVVQALN
ncbi:MAG: putative rane protein [Chthonomonadaceae bacterium]|nr:putative rane protein [Chthonomonadaceae bacterium]